jgi:hypothetical protein
MSHTPGPWEFCGVGEVRSVVPTKRICYVQDETDDARIHPGEYLANVSLIAAAPDLLAGCKAALGAFERNDAINWNDLRKAIEKAEGRISTER